MVLEENKTDIPMFV